MTRLASGVPVEIFEQLDSTSAEARRRGPGAAPLWVIALRQSGGYGRRQREWLQAEGDFAGTLLVEPKGTENDLGQLSFVAALAVASALDELIDPALLRLKWPNDVLVEGGKAAGILLERIEAPGGPRIAIGIGVNVVSAPKGVAYRTARLLDFAASAPAPKSMAALIDKHFWRYFDYWRSDGFARIRALWLERAAGLGAAIKVRLPESSLEGVFDGLDENGALVLRQGEQKRIISAGEVFFDAPRND